jgi:archaetidylinositol phosphate synthase
MSGTSWTHLIARPLVRPMIGTPIRPNHLTTLRLLFGIAACACLAWGSDAGMWWGGGLWLVSAFLDRADGELARLGKLQSHAGHLFDFYSDNAVNTMFFVAIGLGLRHSWLGGWAIPLGLLTGASMFLTGLFSFWLEKRSPPGTKAYSGRWGFDPDDALYMMGPMAWLGWLSPILVGSSVGCTVMLVITGLRLRRLARRA